VSSTWRELIERARQLGLCGSEVVAFGVVHDSPHLTSPESCRYDACVPYDEVCVQPASLFRSAIPAGRYAISRYLGQVAGLERRMRDIYSLWFPQSSVIPGERFTSFDRYVNDEPQHGDVDMDLRFEVRPRS
jgi:AraC family transcriptional regulator